MMCGENDLESYRPEGCGAECCSDEPAAHCMTEECQFFSYCCDLDDGGDEVMEKCLDEVLTCVEMIPCEGGDDYCSEEEEYDRIKCMLEESDNAGNDDCTEILVDTMELPEACEGEMIGCMFRVDRPGMSEEEYSELFGMCLWKSAAYNDNVECGAHLTEEDNPDVGMFCLQEIARCLDAVEFETCFGQAAMENADCMEAITGGDVVCDTEYAPVCGFTMDAGLMTFSNDCELQKAEFRAVYEGECGATDFMTNRKLYKNEKNCNRDKKGKQSQDIPYEFGCNVMENYSMFMTCNEMRNGDISYEIFYNMDCSGVPEDEGSYPSGTMICSEMEEDEDGYNKKFPIEGIFYEPVAQCIEVPEPWKSYDGSLDALAMICGEDENMCSKCGTTMANNGRCKVEKIKCSKVDDEVCEYMGRNCTWNGKKCKGKFDKKD